jgi:hypothetical protein
MMARVLIVQGHARSRADTAATLRAEGHDVLEAGSADNGVRLAHDQGPRSSRSIRCCPTAQAPTKPMKAAMSVTNTELAMVPSRTVSCSTTRTVRSPRVASYIWKATPSW